MSQDTTYISVRFTDTSVFGEVQALLLTLDPLGFLEEDDAWWCYFDSAAWTGGARDAFAALMDAHFPSVEYAVAEFAKQNWNKEWEDTIVPIEASERFVIAPSWNVPAADTGRFVLVIDPKMSFGTGFHETTRLMLRLMEHVDMRGRRVLDVGTGTGVLAIAAAKLGASHAAGVDIDEWSYDNAMENAARNGVTDSVRFAHGSLEAADGIYDVILSNITRNDNIAMFPRFDAMLARPGCLIVSGFHVDDNDSVCAAAAPFGFVAKKACSEGEWSAIHFTRDA
jgi:ribosomal protein L11 methyltransferase